MIMSDILKMFGTVIKSLFKKSACDMYPAKEKVFYKNSRGKIIIDVNKCILCTLCDKQCPVSAIKVDKVVKSWAIDRGKCILCGKCVEVCPVKCLEMANKHNEPLFSRGMETYYIPERKK